MFPGETKIGISQQQRETTKIMKTTGKGEEAGDPSSSSSQDPEWKTWEKTEQI